MAPNPTFVNELSGRLSELDREIGRLVDEREAVRVILSRAVPGEYDQKLLKATPDMRTRVLAAIRRGEVIDAATVTARVRATGVTISTKTVANVLAEHANNGALDRVRRGKYGLSSPIREEVSKQK